MARVKDGIKSPVLEYKPTALVLAENLPSRNKAVMENFCYLPLNPETTSIRLVRLLRGNTTEIECELFHASISGPKATSYEALSYTWGCTELVECVKLNSEILRITENLHSALQCLRYHSKDRVLWIDAICINQEDLKERSQHRSITRLLFAPSMVPRTCIQFNSFTSPSRSIHSTILRYIFSSQSNLSPLISSVYLI